MASIGAEQFRGFRRKVEGFDFARRTKRRTGRRFWAGRACERLAEPVCRPAAIHPRDCSRRPV